MGEVSCSRRNALTASGRTKPPLRATRRHEAIGEWPGDVSPPGSFEYEISAQSMKVLVVLSQAVILSMIPEEYQGLAGMAITGDLPILMSFTAM